MDASNCIYWGLFFDEDKLPKGTLFQDIEHKHVTFEFRGFYPQELVGTKWTVEVTGYDNNGENEGISVCLPVDLDPFYNNAAEPHVTLSVAEGAKPKNTANLNFDKEWTGPQFVEGAIGYFGFDEQYHLG